MNEPVERVGRAQEVGIGGGGQPVEIDMTQRVGQGGGVSSSREALSVEQRLRAAAKAGGQDPDEAVACWERVLSKAMNSPPTTNPWPDPVFHVGFDGPEANMAVFHHGVFEDCQRCNVLAQAAEGQCHEPDFIGMERWVRCVLPKDHKGICFLQPVPAKQATSVGVMVFTVLVLGIFVGFALGVCAAISFGW